MMISATSNSEMPARYEWLVSVQQQRQTDRPSRDTQVIIFPTCVPTCVFLTHW